MSVVEGLTTVRNRAALSLSRAPGQPLGAATAIALGATLNRWAQDAELYAVVIDGELLSSTAADVEAGAVPAFADLLWRLDCFSKPIVSLMSDTVGDVGLALALAGTHRVADAATTFRLSAPASGRLPFGNVLSSLDRSHEPARTLQILAGAPVYADEAFRLGWLTHVVARPEHAAIRAALADADPVDPVCDDRHYIAAAPPSVIAATDGPRPLSEAVRHAIAACRTNHAREAFMRAATYDEALRRLGPAATPATLDNLARGIDVTLPERRVLQAFRARQPDADQR